MRNNSDHNYGFSHPGAGIDEDFFPTTLPAPMPYPAAGQVSVTDMERLAKAGVKVELDRDMLERLVPDPPKPNVMFDPTPLVKPLVERWRQSNGIGDIFPFWLSAVKNGGIVYVFVACNQTVFSAQIIEDDARFYPSEALLAKLHFLLDNHKRGIKP